MAKTKVWEYPASVTLKDKDGNEIVRVLTQLYKATGVYVAIYSKGESTPEQFGLKPSKMAKYMAQFNQDNLKNGFTSEFGATVKVTTDASGFFERID